MIKWDPFVKDVFNCAFSVCAFCYRQIRTLQKKKKASKKEEVRKKVLVKYHTSALKTSCLPQGSSKHTLSLGVLVHRETNAQQRFVKDNSHIISNKQ